MNIVKYRGLSYDKKTWFYGLPTYLTKENYEKGIIDGIITAFDTTEVIIPETLGRFTGKLDIYDNEIYQGDWIQCGYAAVVVWDIIQCCFISHYTHFEDPEDLLLSDLGDIKIIGNIHVDDDDEYDD